MNMVRVKRLLIGLVVLLLLLQFAQPKRTNPSVDRARSLQANVAVPATVTPILERSCGDCHSNQTVWPWYSHVAPLSWLVVDDVNEGRRHLNFSDWLAQESPEEAAEHLALTCQLVQEGGMPPLTYRMLHKNASLSADDVTTLCAWSKSFAPNPGSKRQD